MQPAGAPGARVSCCLETVAWRGWRGQWPFCCLSFFVCLVFWKGLPSPRRFLGSSPPPPSRALVWAFLLVPLAQPSLLETFLRLSPFPATCLLLPAGLRSLEQLLPTHPATLTPCRPSPFLCKFKEPDFLLLSFLRPTPVGGSSLLDCADAGRGGRPGLCAGAAEARVEAFPPSL